jgi:hypothetical protein
MLRQWPLAVVVCVSCGCSRSPIETFEFRLGAPLPAGVAVVNYHHEPAGIDFTEWYEVSVPSPVANTSFIDWLRTRLSLQEAAPYARPDDPSWWLDQLDATGRDTYKYEDHSARAHLRTV